MIHPAQLEIRIAQPGELPSALHLLLGHAASAAPFPGATADPLVDAWRLGKWPDHAIFVALHQQRLVGAMMSQAMPGAVGLIWPPRTLDIDHPAPIQDALMTASLAYLHGLDLVWAQAILMPEEENAARVLLRHDFHFLTTLTYLLHPLTDLPSSAARGVALAPYHPDEHSVFTQTLMASYEETLDCPELNGLRDVDQILEGYREIDGWQPSWWRLIHVQGQPIGVLLHAVNRDLPRPVWELLYFGLIPEARSQGWGQAALCQLLNEASRQGAAHLLLGVDDRNLPALQLYGRMGFEPWEQRAIYLKMFKKERS